MGATKTTVTPNLKRSFPTLIRLGAPLRWIARSRRRLLGAATLIVAIIASPPLWWLMQLTGLPDVGDPFDVAAYRASTVLDERNAFVLYKQAVALLNLKPAYLTASGVKADTHARWSAAVPEVRRWADENRAALALYRQGAERPDAFDPEIGLDQENFMTFGALFSFRALAFLEASRLEELGDMAGAWDMYRATMRTIHHVGMRGDAYRRRMMKYWYRDLRDQLLTWAGDRKTTDALLRRAIDDVVACEALAPSEQDSLKAGYIEVIELLDGPRNPGHHAPLMRFRRFWNPDFQLTPEQIQTLWDMWRFIRREPERSRRVIRLLTANWLAYFDLPEADRPKPDPQVTSVDLYRFGPQAPAAARALPPESLDRWFDTAYDAQEALRFLDATGVQAIERASHADFLVLLGSELYRRDHGSEPPAAEALVGPYLKNLPAEFLTKKTESGPIRLEQE
jgi:hypothetical protein